MMRPRKHGAWKLLALCALAACLGGPGTLEAQTFPNDDVLRQAIQKRFAASKIGANAFQVSVQNGIATLRGETNVAQHKGVATRLAKLAGAREVDNQITISEKGKQKLRESLQRQGSATAKVEKPATKSDSPPTPEKTAGSATQKTPARESKGATSKIAPLNDQSAREATPSAVPRFAVKPAAKRGEARSQRRRY